MQRSTLASPRRRDMLGSVRSSHKSTDRAALTASRQQILSAEGIAMANQIVSDLCQEHKLTPDQLAERAGLEPQRALAIVLGRWTPSPEEREAVAGVFGLTKDQIAWGHKTPIQHIYGHGPG